MCWYLLLTNVFAQFGINERKWTLICGRAMTMPAEFNASAVIERRNQLTEGGRH